MLKIENNGKIAAATILGKIPSKSNGYRVDVFYDRAKKKHLGRVRKSKSLVDYENSFYIQCPPQFRDINYSGFFKLYVNVFYPSNRSDIDGCFKILLDCLQKVTKTIKNDNKCTGIVANKAVDKNNPRIEFKLIQSI